MHCALVGPPRLWLSPRPRASARWARSRRCPRSGRPVQSAYLRLVTIGVPQLVIRTLPTGFQRSASTSKPRSRLDCVPQPGPRRAGGCRRPPRTLIPLPVLRPRPGAAHPCFVSLFFPQPCVAVSSERKREEPRRRRGRSPSSPPGIRRGRRSLVGRPLRRREPCPPSPARPRRAAHVPCPDCRGVKESPGESQKISSGDCRSLPTCALECLTDQRDI